MSRRLQAYPPGLCRMIALTVVKTALRMLAAGRGPGGWLRTGREKSRHAQWSYEKEKEGLLCAE
eukprot:2178481-Pyramimonas_sp.AAC.1